MSWYLTMIYCSHRIYYPMTRNEGRKRPEKDELLDVLAVQASL
jgi:hypothetical protein